MKGANRVGDLPTPIPVVHLDRLEANLSDWAEAIAGHGVGLRPHAKTHKTAEVARRQLEHGAIGLTVAKPSEGLGLLDSGVTELLVAYPIVGPARTAELLALARKARTMSCIDDLGAARALSDAAQEVGLVHEVLVDVDTGLRRTGLPPDDAVELAVAADALPSIAVVGVFSYAGYPGKRQDPADRRAWARQEARLTVQVAEALRERGLAIGTVSVAGTPTARFAAEVDGVTEVRPGIYAFGDANTSWLGAMELDACALRILATVVSRPRADRAVLDAGTKAVAADPGLDGQTYGHLPAHPGARLTRVWEEHGVLELSPEPGGGADLQVGDRVEIVPNHVCPAVNLAQRLAVIEGDRVVGSWEVAAR